LVAIVDLGCIDPNWGTGIDANRPIADAHVEALVKQLPKSYRRYDTENRCQASAPKKVLEMLLASLSSKDKLKTKNISACNPQSLPVINLQAVLRGVDPAQKPMLEAGQHRRAAVLKMNHLPISSTTSVFMSSDLETNNKVCGILNSSWASH
jgi:hypothetical protein